jgi:hypothetical protein
VRGRGCKDLYSSQKRFRFRHTLGRLKSAYRERGVALFSTCQTRAAKESTLSGKGREPTVRGVGDYRNLEVCDVYLEQRPTAYKCVHPRLSRSSLPLPLNPRRFFRLWSSIVLQVTHLISPCVTSALLPLTSTMQHLSSSASKSSIIHVRRLTRTCAMAELAGWGFCGYTDVLV